MLRPIGVIFVTAILIALTFGPLAGIALAVTLTAGLVLGVPIALLLQRFGWTAWWFSVIGGIACSLPVVVYYWNFNPGHTSHVGLYNSIYGLSLGALGGLVFWFAAVFRNAAFSPVQSDWPRSLLVLPVVIGLAFFYRGSLEPIYLHGCIVAYEELTDPTVWEYSAVSVVTDEGETVKVYLTQGYSDPDVVGNCAWLSKRQDASLSGWVYRLHSTSANGCQSACP